MCLQEFLTQPENTCPNYIDGLGDISASLNLPENSLISAMSCQYTLPQSNDYYLRFSLVESSQPYAVLHGDVAPSDFVSLPSLLPVSVNEG